MSAQFVRGETRFEILFTTREGWKPFKTYPPGTSYATIEGELRAHRESFSAPMPIYRELVQQDGAWIRLNFWFLFGECSIL